MLPHHKSGEPLRARRKNFLLNVLSSNRQLVAVIVFVLVLLVVMIPPMFCESPPMSTASPPTSSASPPELEYVHPFVIALRQEYRYILPPYSQVYDDAPVVEPVAHRPAQQAIRTEQFTIATAFNDEICMHLTSSILSGFDVTVLGLGRKDYGHLDKLVFIKQAAEEKKLNDWDVVFYADEDSMYTGQDMKPFFDDFIRRSPEHPDDIDVRKIRRGEAVAPIRFAAEPWCTAVYTLGDRGPCTSAFDAVDAEIDRVAEESQFQYVPGVNISHGRGNSRFLNAGTFIARVWAVKELLRVTPRFMEKFPYPGATHLCDQSIYTALYVDQRMAEARLGMLAPDARHKQLPAVNQFGVHYGLIDIWQANRSTVLAMNYPPAQYQVDGRVYGVNSQIPQITAPLEPENTTGFAAAVFREATNQITHVTERRLNYAHPNGVVSIPIAPPLLSLSPRLMDRDESGTPLFQVPALLHLADFRKTKRIVENVPLTGWHIAMEIVPGQRERSLVLLHSASVGVAFTTWPASHFIMREYCEQTIARYVVNGKNLTSS